jgi:hypothetical protein
MSSSPVINQPQLTIALVTRLITRVLTRLIDALDLGQLDDADLLALAAVVDRPVTDGTDRRRPDRKLGHGPLKVLPRAAAKNLVTRDSRKKEMKQASLQKQLPQSEQSDVKRIQLDAEQRLRRRIKTIAANSLPHLDQVYGDNNKPIYSINRRPLSISHEFHQQNLVSVVLCLHAARWFNFLPMNEEL